MLNAQVPSLLREVNLKTLLPKGSPQSTEPPASSGPGGGGQGPAELGIPIRWIRKRTSG